jgi:tRNA(Ile2) C34 agmatinyltransferase TiaS
MNHPNVIELAEQAVRTEPHCPVCGEPTMVVGRDSGLWLECASLRPGKSLFRRLVTLDASAHTRRHLLDLDAIDPAA